MLKFDGQNIETSLTAYREAWVATLQDAASLVLEARATTLSLKVADKDAVLNMLSINQKQIEQVHIGTVNDRFIASVLLYKPYQGMPILKILERRPGSRDPLGLDSIDYLVEDLEHTFRLLRAAGLPVVKENNEVHAWLSLRFGPEKRFEAKFTDHLVLAVAIKELQTSIDQLLG
jgi:hypothetical protein